MNDEDLKSREPELAPKLMALLRADKSLSPEAIAATRCPQRSVQAGFKAEADAYAVEFRKELSLRPSAPLDMFRLAQHLEIPTFKLSDLRNEMASSASYELLATPFDSPLSAVRMYAGRRRP